MIAPARRAALTAVCSIGCRTGIDGEVMGVTGEGAILANRDGEPAALARLRVVLVRTTHPGNIGAAARAMKTMGLARLVLVAPRHFPDPQATAMATGADDLLARAQV